MKLSQIIDGIGGLVALAPVPPEANDVEITGIASDSRAVEPGALFAAIPGVAADGAKFAPAAVAAGAVAVLASETADLGEIEDKAIILRSSNPRRALALMSAIFFGKQPACAVAVTGTSGKTSVVEFTRQIFASAGKQAASVGTIGIVKPDGGRYGSLTTPDPVSLHKTLSELADEGVTHVAFEASSHGLDQHRLDGVKLTAAAFTNLGRDHLDYHADAEDYLQAKLRLFRELLQPGHTAVVNADGAEHARVVEAAKEQKLKVMSVGKAGEDLEVVSIALDGFVQKLQIAIGEQTFDARLPLIGDYQVENALVAVGLAIAVGIDPQTAMSALSELKGVPGRLEIIGEAREGLVVVDYAHKPEALSAALSGVRPFVKGKLVCVFGCGGDRDRGKRAIMGKIASEEADEVIVTDDNPRSEEPGAIRAEILSGASGAKEIGDRGEAIRTAVQEIGPGDVILIAGKGHETGQIVGDKVLPFSDHEVACEAIAKVRADG